MSCGTCTLCCKIMAVTELNKPRDAWCASCKPGTGCGVYETRPQSCRDFECVWLQSQSRPEPMPPELRPDRSKVVIVGTSDGTGLAFNVEPARPDAWKHPMFQRIIERMWRDNAPVIIAIGRRRMFMRDGKVTEYEEL